MEKYEFRPINSSDASALLNYFFNLVVQDPQRVERIQDVQNLTLADEQSWVDFRILKEKKKEIFTLCAVIDGRIVAVAEAERMNRWIEQHVAEVRFGVLPFYGEAALPLINQLIEISIPNGLEIFIYYHLSTQILGISTILKAGFVECGKIERYYKRPFDSADRIYFVKHISKR